MDHPETIDLGEVMPGETVVASIQLRNLSATRSRRIDRVATSCGCTSIGKSEFVLEPGESIEIPVSMKADTRFGHSTAVVTFVSGAEAAGFVRLELETPSPLLLDQAVRVNQEMIQVPLHPLWANSISDIRAYRYIDDVAVSATISTSESDIVHLTLRCGEDDYPIDLVVSPDPKSGITGPIVLSFPQSAI